MTVSFNGVVVADSERARVMIESRLPPVVYIPFDDLNWDYLERTDHHTFCPFKGNASYWSLVVADRRADNALWSYEDPLQGAHHIEGYAAFYTSLVEIVDEGAASADVEIGAPAAQTANPLVDWLLNDAPACTSTKTLTESFAQRLREAEIRCGDCR